MIQYIAHSLLENFVNFLKQFIVYQHQVHENHKSYHRSVAGSEDVEIDFYPKIKIRVLYLRYNS
jgi:hypothetical protein